MRAIAVRASSSCADVGADSPGGLHAHGTTGAGGRRRPPPQHDGQGQHPAIATGAGGDNRIDHHQNRLGFTYVFIFSQPHYLHPHP
jgi:hypothetical protein